MKRIWRLLFTFIVNNKKLNFTFWCRPFGSPVICVSKFSDLGTPLKKKDFSECAARYLVLLSSILGSGCERATRGKKMVLVKFITQSHVLRSFFSRPVSSMACEPLPSTVQQDTKKVNFAVSEYFLNFDHGLRPLSRMCYNC